MITTEKSLYDSFLEAEEKICVHVCYYRRLIANFRELYCRHCQVQKFKKKLKKYLERMDDDGR